VDPLASTPISGRFMVSLASILARMPLGRAQKFGRVLGTLWYYVLKVRVGLVRRQMQACFPHQPASQIEVWVRQSFLHFGQLLAEFIKLPWAKREELWTWFEATDIEKLKAYQKEFGSILLLTAHYSNWELIGPHITQGGLKMVVITKAFKESHFDQIWTQYRERFGIELLKENAGIAKAVTKLVQEGKVFGVILDQHMYPPGGVESTFLGQPCWTLKSMAAFSRSFGLPVVPVFIEKNSTTGKFRFCVEEPVYFHSYIGSGLSNVEKKQLEIAYNTQRYNAVIEERVKKDPTQWFWLHRRFKHLEQWQRPNFDASQFARAFDNPDKNLD